MRTELEPDEDFTSEDAAKLGHLLVGETIEGVSCDVRHNRLVTLTLRLASGRTLEVDCFATWADDWGLTVEVARPDDAPNEERTMPKLGETYRAGDLPPGSVVRSTGSTEYVIGRSRVPMRWEQPIPGAEDWRVTYTGRLAEGEWMTPRERAEVDEATNRTKE